MDIALGAKIAVEVVKTPSREAACKTLTRLFRRDPRIAKLQRNQKSKRPSREEWTRGGKMWHHQMRSESPVRIAPGARYELRATLDVVRDLASVSRWIKVSAIS